LRPLPHFTAINDKERIAISGLLANGIHNIIGGHTAIGFRRFWPVFDLGLNKTAPSRIALNGIGLGQGCHGGDRISKTAPLQPAAQHGAGMGDAFRLAGDQDETFSRDVVKITCGQREINILIYQDNAICFRQNILDAPHGWVI